MWLNKNTTPFTKIPEAMALTIDTIQHPKNIFTKWTEEELNAIGLYSITISGLPNRRYYTAEEIENFDTDTPTITYIAIERSLDSVKTSMIKDLEATYEAKGKALLVDTGLGYSVRGSRDDLDSLERGKKRGRLDIRDAIGAKKTVTVAEYGQIIIDVEDNGEAIFDTKWTIFDTFMAFTTVAECILYEREPYDYTITAEDVANDADGDLVEGEIVVRHKNNVTDW